LFFLALFLLLCCLPAVCGMLLLFFFLPAPFVCQSCILVRALQEVKNVFILLSNAPV
jgi:hypothetical protein